MAVSAGHARRSVTLPTTLVERLTREQGAGQTLSDVLRLKLEQSYTGMDAQMAHVTQQIAHVSSEVAVIRAALEQLVRMFETWVTTAAPVNEPEAALPVVTYEELYSTPAPEPMASEAEAPQERTRWWHRQT